ncbi:cytochrome P450, partial [Trifolium medium]|nr:cytochrome P450 [Trifolium medium]
MVFSLQLLQDRIPTRVNLFRRGVLPDPGGTICVFCGVYGECSAHLFVTCAILSYVWYSIARWLGWEVVMPRD